MSFIPETMGIPYIPWQRGEFLFIDQDFKEMLDNCKKFRWRHTSTGNIGEEDVAVSLRRAFESAPMGEQTEDVLIKIATQIKFDD